MIEKIRNKKFTGLIKLKLSTGQIWATNTFNLIENIQGIIEAYAANNIKMTLRQLYYQLVAADRIPNDIKVYSKISDLVTDMRYAGLLDWEAIVDRVRIPEKPNEFSGLEALVEAAVYSYRRERWSDQKFAIELLTEKDALSSILQPICYKWHITFCVNRGYTSATAMYDLYRRILNYWKQHKTPFILYVGDHDPSGLDMIRDIQERGNEFLEKHDIFDGTMIIQVALTAEQIKKYNPPPNPAKITDPRAGAYIKKYGKKSWEVDALKPEILTDIVEKAILEYIDLPKYRAWEKVEKKEIQALKNKVKGLK